MFITDSYTPLNMSVKYAELLHILRIEFAKCANAESAGSHICH